MRTALVTGVSRTKGIGFSIARRCSNATLPELGAAELDRTWAVNVRDTLSWCKRLRSSIATPRAAAW